eukprot:gnl/Dysnectes_brevis/101_a121_13287.p1 GENE.gnl/Dysnectes_brevis/101_a121_13287~~gnl/Dysnectes_brevis/101_a121_13287.p1  ORF type:complete len:106 (-),score=18.33 gnl/Dysnectes_brevis/101_a121_13287:88-405(-)
MAKKNRARARAAKAAVVRPKRRPAAHHHDHPEDCGCDDHAHGQQPGIPGLPKSMSPEEIARAYTAAASMPKEQGDEVRKILQYFEAMAAGQGAAPQHQHHEGCGC